MATHANFVTSERALVASFVNVMEQLRGLKRQWDTLGYSGTIVTGDLTGANADLVPADVTSFVTSIQAIDDYCTANFHWANLEKAKP